MATTPDREQRITDLFFMWKRTLPSPDHYKGTLSRIIDKITLYDAFKAGYRQGFHDGEDSPLRDGPPVDILVPVPPTWSPNEAPFHWTPSMEAEPILVWHWKA